MRPTSCGAVDSHDDNEKHLNSDSSEIDTLLQRYLLQRNSSGTRPTQDIYLSSIHNLNLQEFILARKLYCKLQGHDISDDCRICSPFINLANVILEQGICKVSSLFKRLFDNVKYQSDKAVRRLMQLPVAVFRMELQGPGSQCLFVTERQPGVNYEAFKRVAQRFLSLRNTSCKSKMECNMPKESLSLLCSLASSEADRLLIKYTACKSMGLTSKKSKKLYGFSDFHRQEEKILDAIEEAHAIRRGITELAQVENAASLRALGILVPDDSDTEESDTTISEDDSVDFLSENAFSDDEIKNMQHRNAYSETCNTCDSSCEKATGPDSGVTDFDSMKTTTDDQW